MRPLSCIAEASAGLAAWQSSFSFINWNLGMRQQDRCPRIGDCRPSFAGLCAEAGAIQFMDWVLGLSFHDVVRESRGARHVADTMPGSLCDSANQLVAFR